MIAVQNVDIAPVAPQTQLFFSTEDRPVETLFDVQFQVINLGSSGIPTALRPNFYLRVCSRSSPTWSAIRSQMCARRSYSFRGFVLLAAICVFGRAPQCADGPGAARRALPRAAVRAASRNSRRRDAAVRGSRLHPASVRTLPIPTEVSAAWCCLMHFVTL